MSSLVAVFLTLASVPCLVDETGQVSRQTRAHVELACAQLADAGLSMAMLVANTSGPETIEVYGIRRLSQVWPSGVDTSLVLLLDDRRAWLHSKTIGQSPNSSILNDTVLAGMNRDGLNPTLRTSAGTIRDRLLHPAAPLSANWGSASLFFFAVVLLLAFGPLGVFVVFIIWVFSRIHHCQCGGSYLVVVGPARLALLSKQPDANPSDTRMVRQCSGCAKIKLTDGWRTGSMGRPVGHNFT